MLFVYPLGTPLLYLVLLCRNSDRLNPKHASSEHDAIEIRRNDAGLRHLRPLFVGFRVDLWYFEVVDLIRRIIMCVCAYTAHSGGLPPSLIFVPPSCTGRAPYCSLTGLQQEQGSAFVSLWYLLLLTVRLVRTNRLVLACSLLQQTGRRVLIRILKLFESCSHSHFSSCLCARRLFRFMLLR